MKLHFLHIVLSLFITLLAGSCSDDRIGESLDSADSAMDNNDFDMAQKICNSVSDRDSLADLNTVQLCRLSILYMQLAEHGDEDVNVAWAMKCYHKAMSEQSDSAQAYYGSLPVERVKFVHMMSSLNRSLASPRDFFIEEMTDSVEYLDVHKDY